MIFLEEQILQLYRRKIDKIPALIEILRHIESHKDATKEIRLLHRKSIMNRSEYLYDILEINEHVSERFAFLMKLSLVVRDIQKNGNFIAIREGIVTLEDSLKKLILEYNRKGEHFNRLVRIKNRTLIGFLLPGRKKVI